MKLKQVMDKHDFARFKYKMSFGDMIYYNTSQCPTFYPQIYRVAIFVI